MGSGPIQIQVPSCVFSAGTSHFNDHAGSTPAQQLTTVRVRFHEEARPTHLFQMLRLRIQHRIVSPYINIKASHATEEVAYELALYGRLIAEAADVPLDEIGTCMHRQDVGLEEAAREM